MKKEIFFEVGSLLLGTTLALYLGTNDPFGNTPNYFASNNPAPITKKNETTVNNLVEKSQSYMEQYLREENGTVKENKNEIEMASDFMKEEIKEYYLPNLNLVLKNLQEAHENQENANKYLSNNLFETPVENKLEALLEGHREYQDQKILECNWKYMNLHVQLYKESKKEIIIQMAHKYANNH